jgi:hypothetical protein
MRDNKSFVVLCRHGQRAPGKCLPLPLVVPATDGPQVASEQFWHKAVFDLVAAASGSSVASCPASADTTRYYRQHISVKFPIFKDLCSPPSDLCHFPFGALTHKGIEHMQQQGKKLAQNFPELISTMETPSLGTTKVFATNYYRTQVSLTHSDLSICSEMTRTLCGAVKDECPVSVGGFAINWYGFDDPHYWVNSIGAHYGSQPHNVFDDIL